MIDSLPTSVKQVCLSLIQWFAVLKNKQLYNKVEKNIIENFNYKMLHFFLDKIWLKKCPKCAVINHKVRNLVKKFVDIINIPNYT